MVGHNDHADVKNEQGLETLQIRVLEPSDSKREREREREKQFQDVRLRFKENVQKGKLN